MPWDQKKIYVISLIKKVSTEKTIGTDSHRKYTIEYNLKFTDGRVYPVCKNNFLSTIGLKEWSVLNWGTPSTKSARLLQTEVKLINKPARKTTVRGGQVLLEQFLDDLPKLPSHYCRKSSQNIYLEPMFGNTMAEVIKVYTNCWSENGGVKPVSRFSFDQTMMRRKISIQLPKKDKCDLCCMCEVEAIDEENYNIHIQNKNEAREYISK